MAKELLKEAFDGAFSEGVTVTGNVIKNVKLLGRVSKNGRRYSEQAMKDAAKLYENVSVYFDHPTRSEERERSGNRSIRDLAGRVRSPRLTGDEVRGDLQLLDFGEGTVSPARFIAALAEQMPQNVGMSHSASGVLKRGENGDLDVVESLDAVLGHDLVTNPATTAGLFESLRDTPAPEDNMDWKDISLTEIQRNRPDLLESHKAALAESDEQKALREERDRLRKENDDLRAAKQLTEHKAMVEAKLAEAKLPKAAVTEFFRAQLDEAADEKTVDALIADRAALAKNAKGGGPRSTETDIDEEFGGDTKHERLSESEMAEIAPGGASSLFN